jgi:hypothetical protein
VTPGGLFKRFDHVREIGIRALIVRGGLPETSDRLGDLGRHAQRLGFVEIEPHSLTISAVAKP